MILYGEAEHCDVLVIGGAGAGLGATVESRETGVDVVVASKSKVGSLNNTFISYGVLAAARVRSDCNDSPALHVQDTMAAGRFINTLEIVTVKAPLKSLFWKSAASVFWKKTERCRSRKSQTHQSATSQDLAPIRQRVRLSLERQWRRKRESH